MKLIHLDGEKLYYSFFWGRKAVFRRQKHLNKINVFPVADGDTGTNLALTMHSIIEGSSHKGTIESVSRGMADAALSGSHGNSGIIFAQFVQGMSEAVKGKEILNRKEFTHAMKKAVESAYKAIARPVEGTILTVMKAWANALESLHDKKEDFVELIHEALEAARKALHETPNMLKVLKEANVVDAGAEGFVAFLEGMAHFIRHQDKPEVPSESVHIEEAQDVHVLKPNEEIRFRYCTEMLIEGRNLSVETVRQTVDGFGDSLVAIGTGERMKIHIHTNSPADVHSALMRFGAVVRQKIEDMVRQNQVTHHRKSGIALVTDSSCDLPQEILDQYQIHIVPLYIHFGEKQYLDKLSIQSDRFYRMLDAEPEFPRTSQPSVNVFADIYRHLACHYHSILSIHLSGGLSGTFNAARLAAEQVRDVKITVVDSKNLSASLGLMVLQIAEMIASGKRYKDVVRFAESLPEKSKILVGVPQLKSFIRGGRVSPMKGFIARVLNLKPIITLDAEGKAELFGKAFSKKKNLAKILQIVERIHRERPIQRYAVGHTSAEPEAIEFGRALERILGKPPEYITPVSPVIGAHAGTGAVCVSVLTG
jgi:DAK2 domain fusion protein YloV